MAAPSKKNVTKIKSKSVADNSSLSGTKTKLQKKKIRYFDSSDSKSDSFDAEAKVGNTQVNDLSNVTLTHSKIVRHRKRLDISKPLRGKNDPFPGKAPISKKRVKKFERGKSVNLSEIQTGHYKKKFQQKEVKLKFAAEQAARTERLIQEEAGFLEATDGENTASISQHDIAKAVDITSAQKFFNLNLDRFGPYNINYTRNGRFLLIGGKKGHCAAFDWVTKKLMCEINVMETVEDVKWLHIETMFAVAQKQWTYIYDNQGIELHCLKLLHNVLRMEFLPYHFLLATGNSKGYLSYLDISVGQQVTGFLTGLGPLSVMCQNPKNAIVHFGHANGTVTLWSPNVREPLVKMMCHGAATRAVAVNQSGEYMATSGVDNLLKIWDLRTYKELYRYKLGMGPSQLSFSDRGVLAAGLGNVVEVYKDCYRQPITSPYLSHRAYGTIRGLQFCSYEDVLGVGHAKGFSSLLIPGAGEPNFDALEANPFQTKKQRQHAEVKMLLEKIQPDMITLDTGALGQMDRKTVEELMEEKKKLMIFKTDSVDFNPRHKTQGKNKMKSKRKEVVRTERIREQVRDHFRKKKGMKTKESEDVEQKAAKTPFNVFDRFKRSEN